MSALATRRPMRRSPALTSVRGPVHNFEHEYSSWNADKKCPFTGNVSIRGRILTGKVVSTKMTRTLIIRRDYLHYIPKYSALLLLLSFLKDSDLRWSS